MLKNARVINLQQEFYELVTSPQLKAEDDKILLGKLRVCYADLFDLADYVCQKGIESISKKGVKYLDGK